MAEDNVLTVDLVQCNESGHGRVMLSNGMELGKVLGFSCEVSASNQAELIIRVPAVSVHIGKPCPIERPEALSEPEYR